MKKILLGIIIGVLFAANSALAMKFSAPVEIGEIGFPVQAPYNGYIVEGANYNDGAAYREDYEYKGKPLTTYTKGTARFDNLWCKYDFDADLISFGGQNDFVLNMDGAYKKIFRIDSDSALKFYAIRFDYCVTDLKILGTSKDGKQVVYVDSKKLSEKYFDGKDAYKLDGGVLYDVPTCAGDTIIVQYRRWHWFNNGGISEPEGEFRFKWNDAAQSFAVNHIKY